VTHASLHPSRVGAAVGEADGVVVGKDVEHATPSMSNDVTPLYAVPVMPDVSSVH
jgi:hypothetical protein